VTLLFEGTNCSLRYFGGCGVIFLDGDYGPGSERLDVGGFWRITRGGPIAPSKHTSAYQDKCFHRVNSRKNQLEERVDASTQGRVIPEEERLAIGEGKHFIELAVLFLDICGFSNLPNWTTDEQKVTLKSLNLFMGEMLSIVRDFGGTFEKNTGDGLMAYFGGGESVNQWRRQSRQPSRQRS
jgi:hypothetical protein